MPKIKIIHTKNYTVIHNDCIYSLPSFVLGVFMKMYVKRDDFNFSIERFAKEINETRQKTSKAINFLEEKGYLYRKQMTNNTKFGNMIYYLCDVPCLKNGIDNLEIESNSDDCTTDTRHTDTRSTENGTTENAPTNNGTMETSVPLLNTNIPNNKILNNKKINTKTANTPLKQKNQYAEAVSMTEKEYMSLCEKHNKAFADRCIDVLNNYKLSKGKSYTSDYHAILNWVEKKVLEDIAKSKGNHYQTLPASVPIQTDPNKNPFEKYLNESGGA